MKSSFCHTSKLFRFDELFRGHHRSRPQLRQAAVRQRRASLPGGAGATAGRRGEAAEVADAAETG